MDLATFKSTYPEFDSAGDALITIALADAAEELGDPDVEPWLGLYDRGHGLLTAHNLAIAPSGKMARLDPKSPVTTYWTKYQALREQVTCGMRVF